MDHLFAANRAWAARVEEEDPGIFARLARGQHPKYLWIGCSDSRVPANQIIGLLPGEVFVHRNVANLVVHTDFNALSVIQFAVDVLKVEHIIVCGHYGCGGVAASLKESGLGLIDNWLRHVDEVADANIEELSSIVDEDLKVDRLCELNVIAQVQNVARSTILQQAWESGQKIAVHGWIYTVADGLLKDLKVTKSGPTEAL